MPRPASRWRHAAVALSFVAAATSCNLAVSLTGLEGGCPPQRGATQVKTTSGMTPFCIDSTEATNAQYAEFVASGFVLGGGSATPPPAGCEQLTSTTPTTGWPYRSGFDDFPVTNVNWCQAFAFCAWAGKRLCGQIRGPHSDGGALASTSFDDPAQSQWLNACTQGGSRTYLYGSTFDEGACGGQGSPSMLEPVASHAGCVGAPGGLYDMNGNVWEWTDTCGQAMGNPPSLASAFCDVMGGAFDSNVNELTCAGERNWTRSSGAANIGLRCCQDL
jgi:formylglycine-generating enzyme